MKSTLYAIALMLLFTNCQKNGIITVTNKVNNCKLEKISFGDYKIGNSIITNETTSETKITDRKKSFPKKYPLKFYMVANGNTVLLETIEEFELKKGQNLNITIENSTPVKNP